MLSENIRLARKAKGLSQEELAIGLNVVRQTVSKWEQGLSVPDAQMLLALSEALEMPVSALLGETAVIPEADDVKAIARKLEIINLQLARRRETGRKLLHGLFLGLSVAMVLIFGLFVKFDGFYLGWDYSDPETAVAGTALHLVEWLFVRAAPFALAATVTGAILTRKKR